jgi:hypothetical protein
MFNVAETLLKQGRPSVDQLNWIEMSGVPVGAYGLDGRLYCKVAHTQSLLVVPLVWIARQSTSLGVIKTAFLNNVFLTALNGVLVYLLGRSLDYDKNSSLLAAILYGLGTIALPYSKTFFSETLSGLCLIGAMYFVIGYVKRGNLWRLALSGGLLGIASATRLVNLIVVPFYTTYLFLAAPPKWSSCHENSPDFESLGRLPKSIRLLRARLLNLRRPLGAFSIPILLAAGMIGLYNLSRFGSMLTAGYGPKEDFSTNVFTGLYGLLLSPGKSLFLYTPLYLLSLFLISRFVRRHRAEGALLVTCTVAYLLVISKWWAFYGGWCWGPRLLVPLASLWVLPLLELREVVNRSRRWHIVAVALIVVSFAVQGLGSVVNYTEWLKTLPTDQTPSQSLLTVFSPRFTAHRGHWKMIGDGKLDLAWLERQELEPVTGIDEVALLPLLGLLALTGLSLVASVKRPGQLGTKGLMLVSSLAFPIITFNTIAHYSTYKVMNRDDVSNVVSVLQTHGKSGDAILSAAVNHSQSFQNLYKGPLPIYGIRNDPWPYSPEVKSRLEQFAERHERLWLLLEWTAPGDLNSGAEVWLAGRAFATTAWQFGGLRLILYAQGTEPAITHQNWVLNDQVELKGYALSPKTAAPGDVVRLTLVWSALQALERDYTVFVHVLDETGQLVTQLDRQPQTGLYPTSRWPVGQPIKDRYGLLLSKSLPPGHYDLAVGMYSWPTLERLPVTNPTDASDYVLLTSFKVITR